MWLPFVRRTIKAIRVTKIGLKVENLEQREVPAYTICSCGLCQLCSAASGTSAKQTAEVNTTAVINPVTGKIDERSQLIAMLRNPKVTLDNPTDAITIISQAEINSLKDSMVASYQALLANNPLGLTIVDESEPNDNANSADQTPGGTGNGQDGDIQINGSLGSNTDIDFFEFNLQAGDIIGGTVVGQGGLDATLAIFDPSGQALMFNDDDAISIVRAPESPLPVSNNQLDPYVNIVAGFTGRYVIAVASSQQGSSGAYTANIAVRRPVLESGLPGDKQRIYLDFDGATIAGGTILGQPNDVTLSGLDTFLPNWGLTVADRDSVIDAIVAQVQDRLDAIRLTGAVPGTNANYDFEILNSRDNPDVFGTDPLMSRVIIGGTVTELGITTIGIAQYVDVGNFSTNDDSVVLLDFLSGPNNDPNSLNSIGLAGGATIIDLIGEGVGNIAVHELGHYGGLMHTDNSNNVNNIIDSGGSLNNTIGMGPDGIYGSGDDIEVFNVVDTFDPNQGNGGTEDTTNHLAWGFAAVPLAVPATVTTLLLAPASATNVTGSSHQVLATALDSLGQAVADATITFVVNGANGVLVSTTTTNSDGIAIFNYIGTQPGVDTIQAFVGDDVATATISSNLVSKTWIAASSISGRVFVDQDSDTVQDATEIGIPNVTITLTGSDILGNTINLQTTTDANGDYVFSSLAPGAYAIFETQPLAYFQGTAVSNGNGVVVSPDQIINIGFNDAGSFLAGYNFTELGLRPEFITKQFFFASFSAVAVVSGSVVDPIDILSADERAVATENAESENQNDAVIVPAQSAFTNHNPTSTSQPRSLDEVLYSLQNPTPTEPVVDPVVTPVDQSNLKLDPKVIPTDTVAEADLTEGDPAKVTETNPIDGIVTEEFELIAA